MFFRRPNCFFDRRRWVPLCAAISPASPFGVAQAVNRAPRKQPGVILCETPRAVRLFNAIQKMVAWGEPNERGLANRTDGKKRRCCRGKGGSTISPSRTAKERGLSLLGPANTGPADWVPARAWKTVYKPFPDRGRGFPGGKPPENQGEVALNLKLHRIWCPAFYGATARGRRPQAIST